MSLLSNYIGTKIRYLWILRHYTQYSVVKMSWPACNCGHWYMLVVFMYTICVYEHDGVCIGVSFVPPFRNVK